MEKASGVNPEETSGVGIPKAARCFLQHLFGSSCDLLSGLELVFHTSLLRLVQWRGNSSSASLNPQSTTRYNTDVQQATGAKPCSIDESEGPGAAPDSRERPLCLSGPFPSQTVSLRVVVEVCWWLDA